MDTASEFANDTDVHSTPKSDDGYDRLIGNSVPFRGMINEVMMIAPSLRDSDRSCSFPFHSHFIYVHSTWLLRLMLPLPARYVGFFWSNFGHSADPDDSMCSLAMIRPGAPLTHGRSTTSIF